MNKLDKLLHQELRLGIISYLAGVDRANFNTLLDVTEATKGNLSVQLKKLEEAGYLKIIKSFKKSYPLTECLITDKGKNALENYVAQLKLLLKL